MSESPVDLAHRLRAEADAADFSALTREAVRAGSHRGALSRLRSRIALVGGVSALSVGSLGGLAYAANGATPGGWLYGLDRALEVVGVGNGGAAERIAEARALAEAGHEQQSLFHAANAVSDDPGAETALLEAALRLGEDGNDANDAVADLLTYLAENLGAVDGATVADLAKEIAGEGGPADTPAGPPDDTPGEPPVDTPAGPPDDTPAGPPTSVPPVVVP